jgi:hypothetical protein
LIANILGGLGTYLVLTLKRENIHLTENRCCWVFFFTVNRTKTKHRNPGSERGGNKINGMKINIERTEFVQGKQNNLKEQNIAQD